MPDDPIGPPFPGETLVIYDNSKVYWNIVSASFPGRIEFTAVNGNVVKIDRKTGVVLS